MAASQGIGPADEILQVLPSQADARADQQAFNAMPVLNDKVAALLHSFEGGGSQKRSVTSQGAGPHPCPGDVFDCAADTGITERKDFARAPAVFARMIGGLSDFPAGSALCIPGTQVIERFGAQPD